MKKTISILSFLLLFVSNLPGQQPVAINSPNGNLLFRFYVEDTKDKQGCLFYSISYKDKNVILKSQIGIMTLDLPIWIDKFTLISRMDKKVNEMWKPIYGERNQIRNNYNECTIDLIKDNDTNRQLQFIVRVYNEGAAFCYSFPDNLYTSITNIKDEQNEFSFEEGTMAYITPFAQELYHLMPLKDWSYNKLPLPKYAAPLPDYESERPLTLILPNGLYVSLGEAQLLNYARMKFVLSPTKSNTIISRLFGPVTESSPFKTPWRVIMVAEKPGELIENNDIFLNLNPPCAIENTDWIKPGKVIREVMLSTDSAIKCIDFCAKHKIDYIEFDAGWYGYEYSKASDASRVDVDPRRNPKKDLDFEKIIPYAKKNNIGIFIYVNHRALEKQMDQVFPIYQKWGINGLKFGFMHVGSQMWTDFLHRAVVKAAQYNLMVDVHDEYRPSGFSRTYPNLLTQEGIHGNECLPDGNHNTILPFTRFLCGAADYTIRYYHLAGRNEAKNDKTTHAHQLALSVIFYSPLQFVFWSDKPSDYQGEPEVEFFENIPTVWDTTKVILGEIGKYISTARKNGDKWFVGTITNNDGRKLNIPLVFLDKGKNYIANIYSDGGDEIKTRTHVKIDRYIVNSSSIIRADLKSSGGIAMEIKPVTSEKEIKLYKKYK
jgi:alpha-glucosidase